MSILIQNAHILTMNGGKTIPRGYLAVDGGRICAIGEGAPPAPLAGGASETIDARGAIAIPGLINAHTHSAMTLFRGYAGGHPLQEWLERYIFPVEDKLTAEDCRAGALLAICEMLASGTTCCADMYFLMESFAEAVLESGIRANFSRCGQWMGEEQDSFTDEARMREQAALFRRYNGAGGGRLKVDIAVHSVYLSTPNYLRDAHALAKERGARFHIHLSETRKENADCFAAHACSPTEYLYDLGVLDSLTLAAHCVHLTERDMALLAECGASAVHNPGSNGKLASGIASTAEMRSRGVNVALGTDGMSSNNNLDMFREMYLAALLPPAVTFDAQAMDAQAALAMATVNGARALGREGEVGILKEGMAADLVLVDTHAPNMTPCHSAADNLVYAANGGNVRLTMVDGRVLYQDGEFKTLDYEKIRAQVLSSVKRLF